MRTACVLHARTACTHCMRAAIGVRIRSYTRPRRRTPSSVVGRDLVPARGRPPTAASLRQSSLTTSTGGSRLSTAPSLWCRAPRPEIRHPSLWGCPSTGSYSVLAKHRGGPHPPPRLPSLEEAAAPSPRHRACRFRRQAPRYQRVRCPPAEPLAGRHASAARRRRGGGGAGTGGEPPAAARGRGLPGGCS